MAVGEMTGSLAYALFTAVLGMLQFGYHTGVINAPQKEIESFINGSYPGESGAGTGIQTAQTLFSLAVSLFAVGGMVGSVTGGMLASKKGRRGALLIASSLGVVGSVFMAISKTCNSYELLAIGRLIVGLNCGLATSVVPMFVSEIAPVNIRGGMGTVNQLAVTFGLVISQILGIDDILGTDSGWPWLLGIALIPSILQVLLLFGCPESPRYLLITKRDEEGARRVLVRLRGRVDIDSDIDEMHAEDRSERSEAAVSLMEIFKSRSLRAPLIIGIMMHLSQQFSGINGVFYYSTSIFESAGWELEVAKKATIGIGGTMFLMTLVTVPIMDRAGRRTLHLWGLGGMFVSSILMTVALYTYKSTNVMSTFAIIFTFMYCGFFGLGPGSIPWMIMAELFSQGPRPNAMAFGALINWLANFIVGLIFPVITTGLKNASFIPFTILIAIFWAFTYYKLPETKNKTIEEITLLFKQR